MGFVAGFASAFRGVLMLTTTPSLWPYAVAPIVAAVVLLVGVGLAFDAWALEPLKRWTSEALGGAEWAGWTAYGLGTLVGVVVVVLAFTTIVRLVAAPFLALLADRAVARLSGRPTPAAPGGAFVRWVLRPFVEAMKLLAIKLVVTVLALPLLLVPVVGSAAFWLVAAALFGVDLLDVALSARAVLLRDRLRFARSRFAACVGLGVGASLLMFVPCVNVVLLPACLLGAVLLDQRLSPDFPKAAAA